MEIPQGNTLENSGKQNPKMGFKSPSEQRRPFFAFQAAGQFSLLKSERPIKQHIWVPTILTVGPYRFFFYSADGGELPHVHVERERSSAKFWIHPVVLARSYGFARSELLDIQRIVAENEQKFRKSWDDYFGNR